MRRDIFNSWHALSHPGVKASRHLICSRYVWPNIKRNIAHWTRACHDSQQAKIKQHVKAPLQTFEAPSSRFSHIHIYIVGPLRTSSGYTYLFACIVRYTRWPEAIPMTDATAESRASAMLFGWIARFGVSITITSDHATIRIPPLEGTHESAWYKHTTRKQMALVERFHRHLNGALKARLTNTNWIEELPWYCSVFGVHSRRTCHVLRPKWCTVRRYGCRAISFLLKLRKILPRWCLDYVTLCSVNNSFLLDGMEAGLHTFLMTCTRQLMCTFVAMRTPHH